MWETDFHDYRFNDGILQVMCVGVSLHPFHERKITTLQQYSLPPIPEDFTNEENPQQQQKVEEEERLEQQELQ